jgi:hypothetical protein
MYNPLLIHPSQAESPVPLQRDQRLPGGSQLIDSVRESSPCRRVSQSQGGGLAGGLVLRRGALSVLEGVVQDQPTCAPSISQGKRCGMKRGSGHYGPWQLAKPYLRLRTQVGARWLLTTTRLVWPVPTIPNGFSTQGSVAMSDPRG